MKKIDDAKIFFESCREILDTYVADKIYISSIFQVNLLLTESVDPNDIFVFFTAEVSKGKPLNKKA